MIINRSKLISALRGRILLSNEDYETIADVVEQVSMPVVEPPLIDDTDDSIDEGFQNSDPNWRRMALVVVQETCENMQFFTANDFRSRLKQSGIETHDNRAVGGLMRTAKANKWCINTGNVIQSKVGHRSPLQIWKSLLYHSCT